MRTNLFVILLARLAQSATVQNFDFIFATDFENFPKTYSSFSGSPKFYNSKLHPNFSELTEFNLNAPFNALYSIGDPAFKNKAGPQTAKGRMFS
jgi:hypothetical protein